MHHILIIASVCIVAAASQSSLAQGTKADYERAARLVQKTKGKVFKDRVDSQWLADGDRFWYQNKLAGGASEFVFVDANTGTRRPAFDHTKLAAALTKKLGRDIDANNLPIKAIELTADGKILISAAGATFSFDPKTTDLADREKTLSKPTKGGKLGQGTRQRHARQGGTSPDGAWKIRVVEGNLVAQAKGGEKKFPLTKDEKFEHVRIYWAPDSKRFVLFHNLPAVKRIVHMVESSPKGQLQPRLKSIRYTKPGDPLATTKVRLFDVGTPREIPLDDRLFKEPWSIDRLRWAADSSRFTFLYNQRGHEVLRIVAVNSDDGKAWSLIEDAPDTFVNYFQKLFVYFLDEQSEIIWMSERDGWNHLYRFDAKTGKLINQITTGKWPVRGVDWIDIEKKQIWFRACGIYPDQDPYYVHHCRVNFDGTGMVRLTASDGTHYVHYSPDGRYLVAKYSRVDLPPVHELRRTEDGSLVCQLEKADISGLQKIPGWTMPKRFVAKGRDGMTDIYGVIYLPTNFDPAKKYPVLEKIYAGPHGFYVPKKFHTYYTAQQLTEVGFVVVVIDGMGTNWRSKKFLDVCWKNLKDAGFPDRILWMRAAAKKYPYMDLTRVGIYGGSAGGQNALGGLLFHPDFYKVAVADCGCHDNRIDKIHWNEAWMGKVGPHYADNSNVTHAHKMQGKLLLTVGELDTNVDPASTMQVVDALIKADKDFDLLVVPGAGHGVGERPYGVRRRQDFFVRHLLGIEPRSKP